MDSHTSPEASAGTGGANRPLPLRLTELTGLELPRRRGGYDPAAVDALIERVKVTFEDLEGRVGSAQRGIEALRAEAAGDQLAAAVADPTEDALARWLADIDPTVLESEIQASIAQTLHEATLTAMQLRREAKDRVGGLVDAVAREVAELLDTVERARLSPEHARALSVALAQWQGRFDGTWRRLTKDLALPWTAQVSNVSRLLARARERSAAGAGEPAGGQSSPAGPQPPARPSSQ